MSAPSQADVVVVGAGAAGLMAAIWCGRTHAGLKVIAVDGARSLGAKILVAGGGRCNVTHHHVDEKAFAGSSRNAIKKVMRRFDVSQTIEFFHGLGVELKREVTGKLFPVTDKARTVLNALLNAARDAGVEIIHPWRVEDVNVRPVAQPSRLCEHNDDAHRRDARATDTNSSGFVINGSGGVIHANRVILATGGKSLPKTGSDGHGYAIAKSLGHSITPRIFPGLVPLTLPKSHFITKLSGMTLPATLELRTPTGKRIISFTNSTLCTHFGLSEPSVLDISRYYLDLRMDDDEAHRRDACATDHSATDHCATDHSATNACATLTINWLPGETVESMDAALQGLGKVSPARMLSEKMPERLARELCSVAGVDPSAPGHQMKKEQRRALARGICEMVLPITGDRGFGYAEVTVGGVPLSELHLNTMESRICPGLHLCGEICDVDGRIGGFNFQWAWSSGYVAGVSCSR